MHQSNKKIKMKVLFKISLVLLCTFLSNFTFAKNATDCVNEILNLSKFSVKINDFMVSERLGLNSTNKLDVAAESWIGCVRRVHDEIGKACEANDVCATACDLSPNCEIYMYTVAAARCTADK